MDESRKSQKARLRSEMRKLLSERQKILEEIREPEAILRQLDEKYNTIIKQTADPESTNIDQGLFKNG